MTVEKKTNYGSISVSEEAVASLAGGVITECYGVVGMASKQLLRDGWAELLKNENYQGFVSIEMGKVDSVEEIMRRMSYVQEIFSD